MSNKDCVSKRSDKLIPSSGKVGGGAVQLLRKGREEEQAALHERGFPRSWQAHPVNTPSRADDDRLRAAQEESQAFFLHRRVKAADDRYPGIAQGAGEVISLQDQAAGTFDRAEQSQLLSLQDVQVAQSGDERGGIFAETLP